MSTPTELERVAAEAGIRRTVERYFQAMDGRDFERLRDVFLPDATGYWEGAGDLAGIAAIMEKIANVGMFRLSTHVVATIDVELQAPDRATAVTRAVAFLDVSDDDRRVLVRGLVYTDRFERVEAGWRIRHRVHEPTWQYNSDALPPSLTDTPAGPLAGH